MSLAGALAHTFSIFKNPAATATLGLSLLFTGAAHAGTLYDQCLGFVVDISSSTEPHGYKGQMDGITAGMRDDYVVSKISHMRTGMRTFMIVFSTDVKEVMDSHLHKADTTRAFADKVAVLKKPFGGNNNILGALKAAHDKFKALEADGQDCLIRTLDVSGDGAEVYVPHQKLIEEVAAMAKDGITVNGLSFYDVRWAKFTKPFDGYADIHDYYARVIVTPRGLGVRPGMHFTIQNTPQGSTSESIVAQITEQMRTKVRDEVASYDDIMQARFAYALARKPYRVTHNLK